MSSMRIPTILWVASILVVVAAGPLLSEPVRHVLGSEHLRVLYRPRHEEMATIAQEAGQEALLRLSGMLNVEPEQRIDIYVAASQAEFDALTGMESRHSVVGRAIPSMMRVVVKPMGRQRLPKLVAHELAHIMLDLRMGDNADRLSRWLHEGIAQYAAGDFDESSRRVIAQAAVADELLTIDELNAAFHGDGDRIALAYAQSYTLVEYLGDIKPAKGIGPLLDQLEEGRDMRLALGLAFSRPVPEIEREWLETLRTGYVTHIAPPPSETIIGALFVIAFIIALIVVRRRSARIRRRMEREERLREAREAIPEGPYTVIAGDDLQPEEHEPPVQ